MILGIREAAGVRRMSFNRIKDSADSKWRSTAIECFIASDASAILEHTKRWVDDARAGRWAGCMAGRVKG